MISLIIMVSYGYNDIKTHNESSSDKVIKVLIYNGTEADSNCVLQTENILSNSNSNALSNIKFEYSTSDVITSTILANYDVLYMPGGQGGEQYVDSDTIDGDAIKNFVSNGGGYVGICAGAYAGTDYVDGWYNGWGVAPDVDAEHPYVEENLTVSISNEGQNVLGDSGILTISHQNGPAFYSNGGNMVTLATYADNSTGYQDYPAIVGDYYGKGRTVLSGVHPELTPQHPEILINLIKWAANS